MPFKRSTSTPDLWLTRLEYLPPYSPEFNPIEPMWSKG
ncbi:MAG TPA: transposase [Candidatus Paceibacterota bacterium]|nr:transposase [Candidatus Paceibacterota bacterium]